MATTRKQPLDHLRSRKKGNYRRVPLAMDSEVLERRDAARLKVAQLDAQLKLAGGRPSDTVARAALAEIEEAKSELAIAEEALAEDVEWFHVQSMGPKKYEKLVSEHPPTAEQRQEAKKDGSGPLSFNIETFPRALIPACVSYIDMRNSTEKLEPITVEFYDEMVNGEHWTQGEIIELFQAALGVNAGMGRVGDLGNASRRIRRSA